VRARWALCEPRSGFEGQLFPGGDVVVERLAPRHLDVPGRVAAEVVRRGGADQVDAGVPQLREELAAVAVPEDRRLAVVEPAWIGWRIEHSRIVAGRRVSERSDSGR